MCHTLYICLHLVSPEILSDIVDLSDEGRDYAHFICQATGEPMPDISWHFNGAMISDMDTSKYMITSTLINTTTTEKTLIVYNVTAADSNAYTCDASNVIGNDINHGKDEPMFVVKQGVGYTACFCVLLQLSQWIMFFILLRLCYLLI